MAGRVQLTGGSFQDNQGNVLANGYLTLHLSQDGEVQGVGQICSGIDTKILLDANGNVVQNPPQSIWGNDQILPLNTYYRVTGFTAKGQPAFGPNNQQVTGSGTFNTGTWVPNQVISWTPFPQTIVLETNGVLNSTQTLLNQAAGSGISISESGGTVTFTNTAQGIGSSTITAGSAALLVSFPSTFTLNITSEGAVDWIAQMQNLSVAGLNPNFETSFNYTWKKGGWSNGKIRSYAMVPNLYQTSTQTSSMLILSATDQERTFISNRTVNYLVDTTGGSAVVGYGHAIELPGAGVTHTYKVYCYLPVRENISVVAHAMDGTTSDVTLTASENTTQGTIYTFTFSAKIPVGSGILFKAFTTALNSGDTFGSVGIQAITVF